MRQFIIVVVVRIKINYISALDSTQHIVGTSYDKD